MKVINLRKSFIHIVGKSSTQRVNIQSILSTENKKIFLLKESRAEIIGEHPFFHPGRYEFLGIIEDEKTNFIRTYAVDSNKGNIELNAEQKNKKYIVESDVDYLSFEKIHEIIVTAIPNNIFCEIKYDYENIKYSLITKCEYINYNTEKNSVKYLQPIMGYVPFILNNTLRYGYVALNINEKVNGNLEFLLCEKSSLFSIRENNNLIKKLIKETLNKLLFFSKKNNFSKLISLKESKISFFRYY